MTSLATLLEKSAADFPERVAVVAGERRTTYAALDALANKVANLLVDLGVAPGDKVAVSLPNTVEFIAAYFGIVKLGGVVVPLNPLFKAPEFAYFLGDSDAKALIAFEGTEQLRTGEEARAGVARVPTCRHLLWVGGGGAHGDGAQGDGAGVALDRAIERASTTFHTREVDDGAPAAIVYTSGTTGRPKGAVLTHGGLRRNATVTADLLGADPLSPDTSLAVLPLFHVFGQTAVQNAPIARAGTIVLMPRFDPRAAWQLIGGEDVTIFCGVPTMYWAMLAADEPPAAAAAGRLRVAVSAGAALPGDVHERFRSRYGLTIIEAYGLSETSGVSFTPQGRPPRVGSIGTPIAGVEMRLIDAGWADVEDDPEAIGEIAIKGYPVMSGYYKRPEETAEVMRDGWLRTGDLARKDRDGYFFVVDRTKDLIIRGGYNVYPREIEETLMQHPEVSLVAVVAAAHASLGEEIRAVVVRTPGSTLGADDLIRWSKERLAAYKYPRIVEFRDSLPMTATGKILKRELKERAADALPEAGGNQLN